MYPVLRTQMDVRMYIRTVSPTAVALTGWWCARPGRTPPSMYQIHITYVVLSLCMCQRPPSLRCRVANPAGLVSTRSCGATATRLHSLRSESQRLTRTISEQLVCQPLYPRAVCFHDVPRSVLALDDCAGGRARTGRLPRLQPLHLRPTPPPARRNLGASRAEPRSQRALGNVSYSTCQASRPLESNIVKLSPRWRLARPYEHICRLPPHDQRPLVPRTHSRPGFHRLSPLAASLSPPVPRHILVRTPVRPAPRTHPRHSCSPRLPTGEP